MLKGTVDERKFNKNSSLKNNCPYEINSKKRKCTTNNDRISALSTYLYKKIGEIDKSFKEGAISDKRHIEIFMIWLGEKLFKIDNDYTSTLEESYKKNLENSMGSVNYWKVTNSKELYKKATIKKMSEYYNLLNYICKLIIEYNKNEKKPNRRTLINYYTQCDNYYKTIHKSIQNCGPYLQLLDSLKMIYENFRMYNMDIYSKLKGAEKELLLKRVKHLTTFQNENKYLLTVNAVLSFDDKECIKVKSKDEKIGEQIALKKSQDPGNSKKPDKGPQARFSPSASQGKQTPPEPAKPPATPPVQPQPQPQPQPQQKSEPKPKPKPKPESKPPTSLQNQTQSPPTTVQKPVPEAPPPPEPQPPGTLPAVPPETKPQGPKIPLEPQPNPSQPTLPPQSTSGPTKPAPQPDPQSASSPQASKPDPPPLSQNDSSSQKSQAGGSSSGSGNPDGGSTGPAPSTSGGSFNMWSPFFGFLLNVPDKFNKASEFIEKNRQHFKDAKDKIIGAYDNAVNNLKNVYNVSNNYVNDFVKDVIDQLNKTNTPSKQNGNKPGSGSQMDGGNPTNHLPQFQPQNITDPSKVPSQNPAPTPIKDPPSNLSLPPQLPSPPTPPPKGPLQKGQPLLQSQSITPQNPQVKQPNHQKIGQFVKSLSSDLILKKPWNIFPTTWNGSGDCKPEIKFMNATLVCCTSEQCSLTGITVILVLIPIILLIAYKYLSFGSSKKSEKKNMKRVINFHDGKSKTKIIISSNDRSKHLKPVINLVSGKKNSLLNIYKIIQADPMPFINLFFLLIFFVYKRKRDTIE
ncbi:PIR protein CIR protein [Plasmodium vinckei petteri]|uniref:PIR protein CIR protein n=1 Tax=Plasmodium vinckei petteri TaxID=138298 RepID=A0A6V7T4M2_PLAVN|nr:PIR protein CIR protein [Plasmodium vinckei petteri]